jgi:hypothetical protein
MARRGGRIATGLAAAALGACNVAASRRSRQLERALERLRREQGLIETPTLREFVDVYLAQHGGEPETVEKLRWLLGKAVRAFGDRRLGQLRPAAIAACG